MDESNNNDLTSLVNGNIDLPNCNSESSPSAEVRPEVNNVEQIDENKSDCVDNASEQLPAVSEEDVNSQSRRNAEKKDRKVKFPTDSQIVESYLDPPDPWKNVPEWRTEDLLNAYKSSCERHGTKPLNKILKQLQCIENVGERYEILSLKGERLDLRQCESLEDILKHVRFRCIDLEATHIDDEMAVALFEMIEYYESACKLNISFNKGIGPRGWQSCSKLVRKTPCLIFIDARNCDLNERVIPIFGRALRMGCFLQRLQLQSANIAGRALIILVAALRMNDTLKELFIGDNKFVATDGIQIGNLLKYNHKLELLDLRNNHLQDVGIGHICDGLAEQCLDSGLLTLVLWNNGITFQGMAAINKALTTAVHLETLNLGHNPITNEGIYILKDGLLKSKGLLKLGLSGTRISCEGAVALAEVIADNTKLIRVDLQENDVKTAGLMALSLALKVNQNITRLDIDRDTKKESGVKDFAEQQRRLQRDIVNYLETNRDCARKLDEERRMLEEKNRENARKLVEAAEDEVLSHLEDSGSYIPSGDSIHRPKLLFLPQMCPEHDLDSPVLGDQFIFESAANLASEPLTLNIPTGSDLLSPQYCPNPKATAKKIFSVTKVVSTSGMSQHSDTSSSLMSGLKFQNLGSTPSSVINSPTQVHPPIGRMGETDIMPVLPHLCAPLPSVNIENLNAPIPITVDLTNTSPNALQKVLEDHTLVSYIEQIVNSAPVLYEPSSSVENSQILTLETLPKKESTNGIESVPEGNGLSDNCNNLNNTSSVPDICDVNKTPSDVQPSETLCDKSESDRCEVSKCDTVGQEGETDIMTVECVRQCDTTGQENEENIVAVECKKVVGTLDTGASGDSTFIPDDNFDVTDIEVVDNEGNQCDMEDMDIVSSTETERENKNTPHSFESNGFCSDLIQEEPVKIAKPDVDDGNNSSSYNGDECFTSSLTTVPNSVCGSEQFSMNNDIELFENFEEDNILNGDFIDCSGNGLNDDSQNGETTEEITIDTNVGDTEPWNSLNESDFTEGSGLGVDIPASVVKPDFHSNLSFNGLKQELASLIDEETSIIGNGSVKTVKTRECEPNSHYGNDNNKDSPDSKDITSNDDAES